MGRRRGRRRHHHHHHHHHHTGIGRRKIGGIHHHHHRHRGGGRAARQRPLPPPSGTHVPLPRANGPTLSSVLPVHAMGLLTQEEYNAFILKLNAELANVQAQVMKYMCVGVMFLCLAPCVIICLMNKFKNEITAVIQALVDVENKRLEASGRSLRYHISADSQYIYLQMTPQEAAINEQYRKANAALVMTTHQQAVQASGSNYSMLGWLAASGAAAGAAAVAPGGAMAQMQAAQAAVMFSNPGGGAAGGAGGGVHVPVAPVAPAAPFPGAGAAGAPVPTAPPAAGKIESGGPAKGDTVGYNPSGVSTYPTASYNATAPPAAPTIGYNPQPGTGVAATAPPASTVDGTPQHPIL